MSDSEKDSNEVRSQDYCFFIKNFVICAAETIFYSFGIFSAYFSLFPFHHKIFDK